MKRHRFEVMFIIFCFSIAFAFNAGTQTQAKKKKKTEATSATEPAKAGKNEPADTGKTEQKEAATPQEKVENEPQTTTEGAPSTQGEAQNKTDEMDASQKAGAYSVRLRDLEQKVNQLKERIFRSKARLSLLAEKVLSGPTGAGARASIIYTDKMGSSFKLVKAVFILDGVPIYNKTDESGMKKKKGLEIFSAPVVPGEHTLSVTVEYKGNGYGVFAYLNDYKFKVRSSHAFSVDEGKSKSLEVVLFEKGNIATPLEERPSVKFVEQSGDLGSK